MVAIVLLPGMEGSGDLFADFSAALNARSLIVSYPADRPLGYGELTELARASLPSDEPFILLGESFSGPIAIALASEPPPLLRAVVLVGSFARLPGFPFHSMLAKLATCVPVSRAPTALAAHLLLGRFRSAEIEAKLERSIQRVSSEVWKARVRAVLTVDVTSALSRIRAPVLYLRATEDKVIASSASETIAAHVPGTKVVELEAPHCLLQTKPRESAAAIRSFAEEHGFAL